MAFAFLLSALFRSSKTGECRCLQVLHAGWNKHGGRRSWSQRPKQAMRPLEPCPPGCIPLPVSRSAAVTVGFLYVLGTGLVGYLLVQQFVSQVRMLMSARAQDATLRARLWPCIVQWQLWQT